MDLVTDGDEATVEVQPLLGEVDVGPLEAEHLVAAHPGHGRQPVEREESVADRCAHELAQLVLGQRDTLDALEGTLLGCPGHDGHISGHQPAPQRVSESALDEEMDLIDGLR